MLSQTRPPQQFVSFFFLQFNDLASLDTETIIRSCVQQLLSTASIGDSGSGKPSELDERIQQAKSSMFSREQLLELYSTASKFVKDWFIVVDGLDEFSNSQQSSLLTFLKGVESLDESRCIKMLFSSREACSKVISQIFPASTRLVTGRQETSSDIGVYVEDIIIDKVSTGELAVHDPGLIDEIANTIASKEQGM
jgi:archaellum biogenesis ATPase FlaH